MRFEASYRFSLIVAVFCAAIMFRVHAQEVAHSESWRWVRFTNASGLPSNVVYDVMDGPDGTPWAWTEKGIAWYDGFQWHCVDSTEYLFHRDYSRFSGFYRSRLVFRSNDRIYTASRTGIQSLPFTSCSGVWILSPDTLLSRIENHYHYLYADTTGRWVSEPAPLDPDWEVYGYAHDHFLLVNALDHLFLLANGPRSPILTNASGNIRIFFMDRNVSGQSVARIDFPQEMRGLWFLDEEGHSRRLPWNHLHLPQRGAISNSGRIAVLAEDNTIHYYELGRWTVVNSKPHSLQSASSIRFSNDGDLWIAASEGAYLCRAENRMWENASWEATDSRNRVNDIVKAQDYSVWLATSGGIVQHTPDGLERTVSRIRGKAVLPVTGVVEDRAGNIWISSGSGFTGVYKWNGSTWRHVPIVYEGTEPFIHRIYTDRSGDLWFAGHSAAGSNRTEKNPGVFRLEGKNIVHWEMSGSLPHKRVYAFAEAPDGSYWFGTYAGISRYRGGAWTHFHSYGETRSPVTTIAIDTTGIVYFGTYLYSRGLGIIETNDSLYYHTTNNGLPNDDIWEVEVDPLNRVWVTTARGLGLFQNGSWLTFDERSGLNSSSLWPVMAAGDSVFVGTWSSGWAVLDLSKVKMLPPRIVINTPAVEPGRAAISWAAYASWGELAPEEILTRYRINDEEWSPWSQQRSLVLEDIEAGYYTIQVQAKGKFGQYDKGTTQTFTIPLPPLLRWYILGPLVLLVLGIVTAWGLYLYRRRVYVKELEDRQERLKALAEQLVDTEERERRQMAHFLHDSIGQTLSLVYMKLHRWQKKAAPGDGTIDGVRTMLDQVIHNTHTLTFDLCPPFIQDLTLGKALEWVVEWVEKQHGNVIGYSIECESLRVNKELHVLLFMAARELLVNAVKHAEASAIHLNLDTEADGIVIQVVDDGCGFPQSVMDGPQENGGFGLHNMRTRFSDFGVSMKIVSEPGKGSIVSIYVPEALFLAGDDELKDEKQLTVPPNSEKR
ncbi:MAG: hypothetical protein CL946_07980 [Ectothiorhodospiraceae bacterium]|nr:hypothetical protein [Ectothiorhodospiraceae bacterium]